MIEEGVQVVRLMSGGWECADEVVWLRKTLSTDGERLLNQLSF